MVWIVALADLAALAVLALVPLAGPLGLAQLEVPASAILGWLLMAVPLAAAFSVLLGRQFHLAGPQRTGFIQTAFFLCVCVWLICATMIFDACFGIIEGFDDAPDLPRMRGFAMAAFALYSMNLLALWQPFADGLPRSSPPH